MRRLGVVALLALAGCHTIVDHPIDEVVSLQLLSSGGAEACAAYQHEDDTPTECCSFYTRYRIVDLDVRGGLSDRDGVCGGTGPTMLAEAPLSDGGKLVFADSNITRVDAAGASAWTVPSPFGHISAASADRDGYLYLGRGPQVARLTLTDGTVAWISELR
jgi:hypothetical protein